MLDELIDVLVFGKKYQLHEIYDSMEYYCIQNCIDDWKHKIRAMLEERNGVRKLGKYPLTYYGDSTYSIDYERM